MTSVCCLHATDASLPRIDGGPNRLLRNTVPLFLQYLLAFLEIWDSSKCPFFQAGLEMQARYLKALLDGKVAVPSSREMLEHVRVDYESHLKNGLRSHEAHVMQLRVYL
ncbi:hypothetical protein BV898_02387 [Hypsibius exemplaris]|uniref:Uncharacterized protein n=1 Tax=Hypsibius exemplaris TaxID=2072580 RepID=A0A1W0X8A7_HYPEX|nr:hypothetical protein BV898_02387 [Hypsibius exemplaris]